VADAALTEILAGIYEPGPDGRRPPECLYGSVKMWEHLSARHHHPTRTPNPRAPPGEGLELRFGVGCCRRAAGSDEFQEVGDVAWVAPGELGDLLEPVSQANTMIRRSRSR